MTTIESFRNRLKKIGINIEFLGNTPWVYMLKINGKRVKEKHLSNYGFTVFWQSVKRGQTDKITDISLIFQTIRKYL